MKKTWKIKKTTKADNLIDSIVVSKGFGRSEIKKFLNPTEQEEISPYIFSDMKKAKERIELAVKNKEKILIWGDFDCDGITSSVILAKTLSEIKADFACYIPNREQGHGLNLKELIKFISKDKIKLVITVDCGISDTKTVATLNSLKVDTIITDHHKGGEENPSAYAIINPNARNSFAKDCDFKLIESLSNLAGAGVIYKLSSALLENNNNKKLKEELISLSTIGTIGDVAKLIGENRIICAKGIKRLENNSLNSITKLVKSAGVEKINSEVIAFTIVPRINASGRLSDTKEAFELLFSENDFVIDSDIEKLNNLNSIRQSLSDKIFDECLEKLKTSPNKNGIFLFDETWHIGIIGLVASRLAEKFSKPVFLATLDKNNTARCSIRGQENYDIYEILNKNSDLFLNYGGHKLAGGFSFDINKINFETISKKLDLTLEEEKGEEKEKTIDIDLELDAEDINLEFLDEINKLEPFGEGNEKPLFLIRNAKILSYKQIGKKSEHLMLKIEKNNYIFNCVWWKKAFFKGKENENTDILFYIFLNEFNGEKSVRLEIIDADFESEKEKEIKYFDYREKENIYKALDNFILKNPETKVYAKKFDTINNIKDFENLKSAILNSDCKNAKKLIFLDYPINYSKFKNILNELNTEVVYFTHETIETKEKKYFEDIFKMLKFAVRKKSGQIEISKMAETIGISDDFTKYIIDIIEDSGAVNIIDDNKVEILNENIPEDIVEEEYKKENFQNEFRNILEIKNLYNTINLEELF